jgi:hypothetical protein
MAVIKPEARRSADTGRADCPTPPVSTAVLHDLPMPARLAPWPQASRTTLVRCLWLAGLLHLWAMLWLGSAPEGTAPPGAGVQGRLNVTLRGPLDDGAPSAPPPQAAAAPAAEAAARLGGRVRDTPLPPDATTGAERLGPAPMTLPMAGPMARQMARQMAAPLPELPPLPAPSPIEAAVPLPVPPIASLLAPLAAEGRLGAGSLQRLLPSPAAPLAAPSAAVAPALPALPVAPLAELAAPRPAVAPTPTPTPLAEPAPAPTQASTPAAPAAPGPEAARPAPVPATDSGPRIGADIAVPAAAASAPKRLNLELGRLRGGELSRHGTAGVLPVLPRPPETDKLAAEIEKAARADCRKAHAGAGILAVVPLAIDAMRGTAGCKW